MIAPFGVLTTVRRGGRFAFSSVHVCLRRGSYAGTVGGDVLVIVQEGDVNRRVPSQKVSPDVRDECERLHVDPDEIYELRYVYVYVYVSLPPPFVGPIWRLPSSICCTTLLCDRA